MIYPILFVAIFSSIALLVRYMISKDIRKVN